MATVASSLAIYLWYRTDHEQSKKKKKKKRLSLTSLRDLQGNSRVGGSDILRFYSQNCNNKDPIVKKTKTVLITGTTSGLGRHTAMLLLGERSQHDKAGIETSCQQQFHLILGVRDVNGQETIEMVREIRQRQGAPEHGNMAVFQLDLASFASVEAFAEQVKAYLVQHESTLDVLIHNAGVFGVNGATVDGFQTTFQVNVLAPALLTELLLPVMTTSQDTALDDAARILFVSSEMHRYFTPRFRGNIANVVPPNPLTGASATDYALSKSCQILYSLALNQRLLPSNTESKSRPRRCYAFAIEPGLVPTRIGRHTKPQWLNELQYWLLAPLVKTVDQGCSSTIFCTIAPLEDVLHPGNRDGSIPSSCYYVNCQARPPKKCCLDPIEAQRLAAIFEDCFGRVKRKAMSDYRSVSRED